MKVEYINKAQASDYYDELIENDFQPTEKLSIIYQDLRRRLIDKNDSILKQLSSENDNDKKKYEYDVRFGIALYEETNRIFQLRNNNAIASNENFWIYINMLVIPDIIYTRWIDSNNKRTRFYSFTKRIYTNYLWWYIHLGWQVNSDKTLDVLRKFNTDTIVQLVERVGDGYNLDLYREILSQLHEKKLFNNDYFRKLMKLNTIYIKTIHPEFYKDGIKSYVNMLINKIR